MKISAAFDSKYLRAVDLGEREIQLTMSTINMEPVDSSGEKKPVLYFTKGKKGLVLNKTNATRIAKAYGDDTEQWPDNDIILFSAEVDFKGEMVEAIRVKIPKPVKAAAEKKSGELDDEIPF